MALKFLNNGYFAGKVGIGIQNPAKELDVSGDAKVLGTLTVETANNNIRLLDSNDNTVNFSVGVNGRFQVRDVAAGTNIFQIEKGAASDSLYIDSSGNVGIGTNNPGAKLEISKSQDTTFIITSSYNGSWATQNYGHIEFKSEDLSGTTDPRAAITGLQFSNGAYGGLGFSTHGLSGSLAEAMRIDQAGNVGIGTTSPAGLLHVSSGTSGDALVIIESDTDNDDENDNPQLQFKQDGGNTIAKIGLSGDAGTIFTSSLANAAYFGNDEAASVQLYTNATARLTIESGGDVGIGTTNPLDRLHVDGARSNFNGIKIGENGNKIQFAGVDGNISVGNNNWLIFSEGATEFMRSGGSSGNIGISTTSPTQKLHVAGNARVTGAYYDSNNSPGTANQVLVSTATGTDWVDGSGSSIIGGPYLPLSAGSSYPLTGVLYLGNVASDQKIQFQRTGGNVYSIEHDSNKLYFYNRTTTESPLIIQNDGDVLMNAGNVGIGTTSPDTKLHVEGDLMLDVYNNGGSGNGIFFREGFGPNDANPYNISITIFDDGDGSPDALDLNAFDGIYFNTGSGTRQNRGYVDLSGNWYLANTLWVDAADDFVGIGTTSPGYKLDVNGVINVSDNNPIRSSNEIMIRRTNSTNLLRIGSGDTSDETQFYAGGLERMRIDSSGNVGIGLTNPVDRLDLYDADDNVGMYFHTATSGTGGGNGLRVGQNNANAFVWNYEATPLSLATGGTARLTINATGGIRFNTGYGAGTLVTDASGNITVSSGGGAGGPYLPLAGGTLTGALTGTSATFTGNVTAARFILPSTGTTTPVNRYLYTDNTNTGTGKLIIQSGAGSAAYGGAINLFSNSHASKPGWVTAGISSGSGGKFTVNSQGLAGGTDVFTVNASGNATFTGTSSALTVIARDNLFVDAGQLYIGADNASTDNTFRQVVNTGAGSFTLQKRISGTFTDILSFNNANNATFAGQVNVPERIHIGGATSGTKTLSFESTTNAQVYNIDFYNNVGAVQGRISYAEGAGSISLSPNIGATAALDLAYNGDATFAGSLDVNGAGNNTFTGNILIDNTAPIIQTNSSNNASGFRINVTGIADSTNNLFRVQRSGTTMIDTRGNGNTTFTAQAFSAATSSGDGSSTLTTKGYVDSLITGATIYRGTWDPDVTLNSGYGNPNLNTVTKTSGYYYICDADGTATPNGTGCEPDSWSVGDWVIWNDDIVDCAGTGTGGWQKIDNSSVLSGVGTGQTVALWEGASSVTDSETLGNAPITVSGTGTTFAGAVVGTSFSAPSGFINGSNGGIRIHTSGTKFFNITAANAARDNIMDIGAADARFKDLFLGGSITADGATFAGDVTLTNGQLTVTHDTNNVAKIIQSATSMSNATYTFEVDSSSHNSNMSAAGAMAVDVNSGRAFTITGAGKVGIGETSPSSKLEVRSETATHQLVSLNRAASVTAAMYLGNDSSNNAIISSNYSDLIFGRDQSSTLSEWMRIKRDGNVGIGTDSPIHPLYVAGDIGQTDGSRIWFRGSSSSSATGAQSYVYSNGLNLQIKGDDNVQILGDGGGVIAHFDYTGKVGIGTTSPSYKLRVSGGGIQAGGKVTYTKSAGSLNTTGYAVAGLTTSSNGQSAGFTFTCFGHTGGYQKIVYSCYNGRRYLGY